MELGQFPVLGGLSTSKTVELMVVAIKRVLHAVRERFDWELKWLVEKTSG